MKTVLKSYKKVTVRKPLCNGKVAAGEYIVRHSDKFHTILWRTDSGDDVIIGTPVYLSAKASGLIQ